MLQNVALSKTCKVAQLFYPGDFYPADLNDAHQLALDRVSQLCKFALQPGIIDDVDPGTNSGALKVELTAANTFQLYPGYACYSDGQVVWMDQQTFTLDVPSDVTSSYVLTLHREISKGDLRYYAKLGKSLESSKVATFSIGLYSASEFMQLGSADLANEIVLASLQALPSPNLSFALYSTPNTLLQRRQFSCLDYEHRSKVGAGVVSNSNPHGLSLSDLDVLPGLSFWETLNLRGVISTVRSDKSFGDLTTLTVSPLELLNNVAGGPTRFVMPKGAAYVLSVTEGSSTHLGFTYDRVTREVICYPGSVISNQLTVRALVVHAGTVTVRPGSSTMLDIEAPIEKEYFISSTQLISELQSYEFDVAGLAGLPSSVNLMVSSSGALFLNPIPVATLDLFNLHTEQSEIYLEETGQLLIALTNFIVPATWSLQLRISGMRGTTEVSELLTLNQNNYAVAAGTNMTVSGTNAGPEVSSFAGFNWIKTAERYSSIQKIEIVDGGTLDNLPTSLQIVIRQKLTDLQDCITLAGVSTTNRGHIRELLDLRDQRVGMEKFSEALFYENFYNPLHYSWPHFSGSPEGLSQASWMSVPFQVQQAGSYKLTVQFDVLTSLPTDAVKLVTDFSNNPGTSTVTKTSANPQVFSERVTGRQFRWVIQTTEDFFTASDVGFTAVTSYSTGTSKTRTITAIDGPRRAYVGTYYDDSEVPGGIAEFGVTSVAITKTTTVQAVSLNLISQMNQKLLYNVSLQPGIYALKIDLPEFSSTRVKELWLTI